MVAGWLSTLVSGAEPGSVAARRVCGRLVAGTDLTFEIERKVSVDLDHLHELPAFRSQLVQRPLRACLWAEAKHRVLPAPFGVQVATGPLCLEPSELLAVEL